MPYRLPWPDTHWHVVMRTKLRVRVRFAADMALDRMLASLHDAMETIPFDDFFERLLQLFPANMPLPAIILATSRAQAAYWTAAARRLMAAAATGVTMPGPEWRDDARVALRQLRAVLRDCYAIQFWRRFRPIAMARLERAGRDPPPLPED